MTQDHLVCSAFLLQQQLQRRRQLQLPAFLEPQQQIFPLQLVQLSFLLLAELSQQQLFLLQPSP
jgi:hypothetical protein